MLRYSYPPSPLSRRRRRFLDTSSSRCLKIRTRCDPRAAVLESVAGLGCTVPDVDCIGET
eukprot:3445955-Rhodomonas_salina.1